MVKMENYLLEVNEFSDGSKFDFLLIVDAIYNDNNNNNYSYFI